MGYLKSSPSAVAKALAIMCAIAALAGMMLILTDCQKEQATPIPTAAPTQATSVPSPAPATATSKPQTATPKPVTAAPTATAAPAPPPATAKPSPAATARPVTPAPPSPTPVVPAALRLEVTQPADEATVKTSPITVTGTTSLDATVSVNGTIATVAEDGTFTSNVDLTEGPNLLEVIASDPAGNQVNKVMTVMYLP